ncbi:hypothetical protein [Streptomyces sp. NPDC001089]
MKATLVMESVEIGFDMVPPDVPVTPGASLDLPLDGYVVHTRVTELTITVPVSRIVLRSPAIRGRTFRDVAADLERTDYASNVTARDLDAEEDD